MSEDEFRNLLKEACQKRGLSMRDFAYSDDIRYSYNLIHLMIMAGHLNVKDMINYFLIDSQIIVRD